ncbi:TIGR04139 family peptide modification target [Sphingobacterium sp. SRCM116780]|uniref:TIGR04139 family peptide modification target n=1 Tax=Sphingobacterium sp. SRCM116780 TaxID=2907623 RepID=UPI001F16F0E2|nr:TIGR04139 family peptide modification target [Sphingobacterium sp. SRCM116780]UIR55008.1 TIGR04139 family peptide modification target [Sphingobacterium sp. SRCM116780]
MKKLIGMKDFSTLEKKKVDMNIIGGLAMSGGGGFYEIQSNFVDAHGCYDVDVYDGNGGAYLSRVWIREGGFPHLD